MSEIEINKKELVDEIEQQPYDIEIDAIFKGIYKPCKENKDEDEEECMEKLRNSFDESNEIIVGILKNDLASEFVDLYIEFNQALIETKNDKSETNIEQLKKIKMDIDNKLIYFLNVAKDKLKEKLIEPKLIAIYFDESNITKSNIINIPTINKLYESYRKLTNKGMFNSIFGFFTGNKNKNDTSKVSAGKKSKRKTISKKKNSKNSKKNSKNSKNKTRK